jgi:hypothetical protein
MDNAEVIAAAAEQGLELVERVVRGECVHDWARGDDERWPCCYREQWRAIAWMEGPLHRRHVFA